jgi:hypothetical protein
MEEVRGEWRKLSRSRWEGEQVEEGEQVKEGEVSSGGRCRWKVNGGR